MPNGEHGGAGVTERDQEIQQFDLLVAHAVTCWQTEHSVRSDLLRSRRLPLVLASLVGGVVALLRFDDVPQGVFRWIFPVLLFALYLMASSAFQLLNIGLSDTRLVRFLGLPIRHQPQIYGSVNVAGGVDIAMFSQAQRPLKGVRHMQQDILRRLFHGTAALFADNMGERLLIVRAQLRLTHGILLIAGVGLANMFFGNGGHTTAAVERIGVEIWTIVDRAPPWIVSIVEGLTGSLG